MVAKGQAYGIRSICVDGNDTLAVYATIKASREMAISENRPILIEVECYELNDTIFVRIRSQHLLEIWWGLRRAV